MFIESFVWKKFNTSFLHLACDNCTGTNLDDWFLDKQLEISSNMRKYRKLIDISTKSLSNWVPKCAGE